MKPTCINDSEYEYVESEWMFCIDGITQTACEFNRKTGESRPYDYEKATREMVDEE